VRIEGHRVEADPDRVDRYSLALEVRDGDEVFEVLVQ